MQSEKIWAYIESHREEALETLRTLVNLEGHYSEKENVERARDYIQRELEKEGFVCHIREVAPDKAGMLVGILGADRPGKPVLFSGHLDTVYLAGDFDGEDPFRVEDGKVYGPGVLDMKGGIIIALYAIKALNAIGFDACPIKILFLGEEECDHIGTDADTLITQESMGARCAFNMECGDLDNRLGTARKSQHTFFMTVKGEGGHAGNDFWRGKNAIHEAVHKIQQIIGLTDAEQQTTVTTSILKGGGMQSAIADHCEAVFDVRVTNDGEKERIYRSMEEIMAQPHIPGTTTTYTYYAAKLAPLMETDAVLSLWNFVNKVATDCGAPPFGKMLRGGATDAGNIAAAGVPTLCACGICGDFAHNKKEYAMLESLYERAKIFAAVVARIDEFTVEP